MASGEMGYRDYIGMVKGLRKTFEGRLDRILVTLGGTPQKTLDVGCGPGVFVCLARQRGWNCVGAELSAYASKAAARKFKVPIVQCNFADGALRSSMFDVVTLWDVIEHLERPADAIREIHRILIPKGHVFVTTGDVGSSFARLSGRFWHLYNLPEHLFFFNREAIGQLLERNGFLVRSISTAKGYYSVSYLIERFAKSLGWKSHRTVAWLTRRSLLQEIVLPMDLRDIMLVHAQKVT